MKPFFIGTLLLTMLVACSVRHELENQGAVCLTADTPVDWSWRYTPQILAEGAPVGVFYLVQTCLSRSCDIDRSASCTATVEGDRIIVESRAGYTRKSGNVCTDDCGFLHAACETPPLTAGTYQVDHGDDTITLSIPSEHPEAPCTEEPFW
jgi:hypothetical protein